MDNVIGVEGSPGVFAIRPAQEGDAIVGFTRTRHGAPLGELRYRRSLDHAA